VNSFIHKNWNRSLLLYHFACPTNYRHVVVSDESDELETTLVQICLEISDRYEIEFFEIGVDKNQIYFLIQSAPTYSPTRIITIVKSITGRELFARIPALKKALWRSAFWSNEFYVDTVEQYDKESGTHRYIAGQGLVDYRSLYEAVEKSLPLL